MTQQRRADTWPWVLFALHLAHALMLAHLYPQVRFDPDLLAYFVYFRNWLVGDTALHHASYFTHPKPLPVFVLGPLGDVPLAFFCSAIVSAGFGSLTYLVGRRFWGRRTALVLSLLLLLDNQKATLTLKSSADLYLGFFLFCTIHLAATRRLLLASGCLFLSALVKPVTLPCALYFLTATEVTPRRRWLCALLPLVAIPLILVSYYALLGTPLAGERFFAAFDALSEGTPIGPQSVLHFVVWEHLVKYAFISTAPLGFVGLAAWLARDKQRLTSPMFLLPMLFLIGYVLLGVLSPYVPFFRFYWPLEVWFSGFIVFGILEMARRVARGQPRLRVGMAALALFFLADDYLVRLFTYRDRFAVPFQTAMTFVSRTPEVLRRERRDDETILAPLAFVPYLTWALEVHGRADLVIAAEAAARDSQMPATDWVLSVPAIYANRSTREFVAQIAAREGYEVRLTDGEATLLGRPRESRTTALR